MPWTSARARPYARPPASRSRTLSLTGRLDCTARAMWKLTGFLREFGYDTELLGKDEIDDQALVGLEGVLKVSHAIVHGISVLNLDGFAPLSRWKGLSPTAADDPPESEVAS